MIILETWTNIIAFLTESENRDVAISDVKPFLGIFVGCMSDEFSVELINIFWVISQLEKIISEKDNKF